MNYQYGIEISRELNNNNFWEDQTYCKNRLILVVIYERLCQVNSYQKYLDKKHNIMKNISLHCV